MRSLARPAVAEDGRRPRGRAAPPRPRKRRRGLCLSQARPSQAVGRRPAGLSPLPRAQAVQAGCGRGPAVLHGPAQYFLNELISIYYLLI